MIIWLGCCSFGYREDFFMWREGVFFGKIDLFPAEKSSRNKKGERYFWERVFWDQGNLWKDFSKNFHLQKKNCLICSKVYAAKKNKILVVKVLLIKFLNLKFFCSLNRLMSIFLGVVEKVSFKKIYEEDWEKKKLKRNKRRTNSTRSNSKLWGFFQWRIRS